MASKWLEWVTQALRNLGGAASLKEIYAEVQKLAPQHSSEDWEATIRQTIYDHSEDSDSFRTGDHRFYSEKGIGEGFWGLSDLRDVEDISESSDIEGRSDASAPRRNQNIVRYIKRLHGNKCQLCDGTIEHSTGHYSEAHHIRPLGKPHGGDDKADNIMVVCPNHHKMLHYGVLPLDTEKLNLHPEHKISPDNVAYHNDRIYKTTQ